MWCFRCLQKQQNFEQIFQFTFGSVTTKGSLIFTEKHFEMTLLFFQQRVPSGCKSFGVTIYLRFQTAHARVFNALLFFSRPKGVQFIVVPPSISKINERDEAAIRSVSLTDIQVSRNHLCVKTSTVLLMFSLSKHGSYNSTIFQKDTIKIAVRQNPGVLQKTLLFLE